MIKQASWLFILIFFCTISCYGQLPKDIQATQDDYRSANIGVLKYVPAGSFQRDSDSTNISTVSAFRMSQHLITRAQFVSIMGTDPSEPEYSSGTTDPVQTLSWYHAIAFCNKLSIAEGLTPAYTVSGVNFSTLTYSQIPTTANSAWNDARCDWSANGYRLPTEMEWMWAAMGASRDSRRGAMNGGVNVSGYSKKFAGEGMGGNKIDYAWFDDNAGGKTRPVGTKKPNELGLYDMSGNVWEWCWDWWGFYPSGSLNNYRGTDASTLHPRVVHGGSFGDLASALAVASRTYGIPQNLYDGYGFRVVRP